ncbi:MAG: type I secretion system permease/ATPase [Rhizobiaceae bacterium]
MKSLKKAKSQFKRILFLLAGFSFVVNLLMLTMPLYMLQIYDRILSSQSMDTLTFLSVIAAAALVVLGLIEAVRAVLASRAAARMEAILGADALRISMANSRLGEADIQPMRDLANIRSFVSSRIVFSLLDIPFAPLFIGILYIIHPTLFWLTLAGAVVLFLLAILNQRLTSEPSATASSRQGAAMLTAQSMSRNAHALRAMGMTQNAIALWGAHNADSLVAQGRVDTRNAVLTGLSRTIRMGLQIAILGVGALLVLKNEMTAGMIFASSIISGRGLQPIDQVIGGWKQIAATWRSWKNLQGTLNSAGDEVEKTILDSPKGGISVEGATVISAAGLSKAPILNRISFAIQPGDVLGIVGPSGSGKSTLARLLVGAQIPQAGVVRIDGTDIQNWDPTQLGIHIGYLGQEMELLPGTVSQNIARLAGQPDAAAVLEAAQKAKVHALIQGLPQGYDTLIGPGGMGLSGGQRQRVGLARAFYGNPQIMILDEPNANLDDDGELALHQAIFAARQTGVTIILITQRKQILNGVDKVLRLHQGNVDFMGTREEFAQALQARREKVKGQHTAQTKLHSVQRKTQPQPRVKRQAVAAHNSASVASKQLPGSPFPPTTNRSTRSKKDESKD